jgi:protein involved in polysaccharide export with SLBB domain
MKNPFKPVVLFILLCSVSVVWAQFPDEEEELRKKQSVMPKAIDFSQIFGKEEVTREEFELWKRQRQIDLQERLSQIEALEGAVDPETYIVGPGDIFSFNIWGAMEMQIPLTVTPEGKLLIPSVGEIDVSDKKLGEVKEIVLEEADKIYNNTHVSLTLEALRFFRVHVVGEVNFPGTYIAQAVDRISEMIIEAGGVTERAWKGGLVIRHSNGTSEQFDLAAFEQFGDLSQDRFVNGGDVIQVPSIDLQKNLVQVEADQEAAGTYQIFAGEKLVDFLKRIRAMKRNTDLTKVLVIRRQSDKETYLTPFMNTDSINVNFSLEPGDRIILPSHYVYVKGAVRIPGAYPYVFNLTAKEYAGMAGGDFRSGTIKGIKVYHARTGKTKRGPDIIVEPGDVVHLKLTLNQRIQNWVQIVPTITSLVLAAHAAGLFGE